MFITHSKTINKFSLIAIFCISIILIFFCRSAVAGASEDYNDPFVEYSISHAEDKEKDPLTDFNTAANVDPAELKNVTMGIIFTTNTIKSMELIKINREKFSKGFLKNDGAMEDLDASFLPKTLSLKLRQIFKNIVVLSGRDDPQSQSVDAIMYLDIRITLGTITVQQTNVAVQGIIVDRNNNFIVQVKGAGIGILSAYSFGFKTASNQAIESFNAALGEPSDLVLRLKDLALANAPQIHETITPPELQTVNGSRIALVIGNGSYSAAPLKNTIADAKIVASSLTRIGINTTFVENIKTAKEFVTVLKDFNKKAKAASIILFYYAGHGMQIQGKNYLIPVAAQLDVESDVDYECLDLDRVLAILSDGNNAVHVAIIDACRDNPFLSTSRSLSTRGLSVVSKAPSETLIAYSTSPGSVALDGEGKNGPYASAFAAVLAEKNLQIEDIFKKVRATVNKETNGKQIPWESSSIEKEVVLNP